MARKVQPYAAGGTSGTTRLSAHVAAKVSRRRALSVLGGDGRGDWLGETVETEGIGDRERHLVDLELRVNEQTPRITFRKAAYVDVGPARAPAMEPIEVGISWRAAGLAPLFPVFSGTLTWADGELELDGYYAPPGGELGVIADRLLMNVAARGTARVLLKRIAEVMRAEPA
ncbi:MAG TPA: hypothetical protein VIM66_05080 [Candidatus Limnocylindria bacterium]|jgi:hypothetical protein